MTKQDVSKAKKAARVITETPAGSLYEYTRSGRADYASNGYLYGGEQTGKTRFVFGEDNKVYVRNLLYNTTGMGTYWVEGTLDGDVLTIPLGQSIYWSDTYQADVVLCWGEVVINEEGNFAFVADEDVTEVTYLVGEDGSITLQGGVLPTSDDSSEDAYYLGTGLSAIWTDDASWSGYCEFATTFSDPVNMDDYVEPTVISEQPDGDFYSYYRSGACIANSMFGINLSEVDGKLNVVFDTTNGKVYIQNPMWWHDSYNSWVEGTYDWMTGVITIPVGQYLSWNSSSEYGIQLFWGSTDVYQDYDEEGELGYYLSTALDRETTEIQFMIDDDVIVLLNSEGDINAEFPENYIATGMYTKWSDEDDENMQALEYGIKGQIVNLVPAVPADPIVAQDGSEWYDCGDESGFSKFYFELPTTDVDGNMLDPECLSYSIFTDDDEIFVFSGDVYTLDLEPGQEITEVPYWLYSNAVDFKDYFVYMYRTNAEGYEPLFTRRIGIQAIYTVDVPEGGAAKVPVVNKSNIVYNVPDTHDAIESVKAELDTNAPVYNVMGQKMNSNNLPAGIYIQNGKKFIVK